jgi:hypothetical protein
VAASSFTVSDGSKFDYFSAVCWFFGKNVHDGLGGKVPIGLVSNNWPGTKVEQWTLPETTTQCGHTSTGELYNAMIVPYTVGPMAVSGFTWCKFSHRCCVLPHTRARQEALTCIQRPPNQVLANPLQIRANPTSAAFQTCPTRTSITPAPRRQ